MPDSSSPQLLAAARSMVRRHGAAFAVLAGGLLGAGMRSAVTRTIPVPPDGFPLPTLAVNLAGSLLLGGYLARRQRAVVARFSLQFWAIGALGSFTTFSTFSLEVVQLLDRHALGTAVVYVAASTVGGLACVLLGTRLGRAAR
jgi:CrcB protein